MDELPKPVDKSKYYITLTRVLLYAFNLFYIIIIYCISLGYNVII